MSISQEKFDKILFDLINQNPASDLLRIPGVYEAVAEEYNNMVLEHYELEQELFGYDEEV